MLPTNPVTQDPFDRFREIYRALNGDTCWWSDGAWLRFAAQAAILGPAGPGQTARAIRNMADQLQQHVQWYNVLSSPLNLVVAATLVQRNKSVKSFNDNMTVAAGMLRDAGLTLGGSSLIKTVLIMNFIGDGATACKTAVQRVSQIYTIMKRNHWWLTGRGDICVCALLAANNGMPIVIEGMADEIYRRLIDHGFNCEHHVLIAANILTMADIPAMTAVDRFLALIAHVQASAVPSWTENFDSLALLSLLGHGPERITERLNAMTTRLKGFKPLPFAAINFAIAADLVFLELVRLDDDLVEIAEPVELMRMEQLIHYQSAISFLMVDVPQEQILMASGM